jgi:steroid 5-alpha reductase family enzyme
MGECQMSGLFALDFNFLIISIQALILLAVVTWVFSAWIQDVSIVDYIWSLLTLLAVVTYSYLSSALGVVGIGMLVMVAIWAIRLAYFLIMRGHNKPEDRRYQVIRERNSPNFTFKSLYLIFIFQATVAWVMSVSFVPVFDMSIEQQNNWTAWHSTGALVWLFGFIYESVADHQLHSFNRKLVTPGSTLKTGLWRYSRHPNYFGELCVWWGWCLYAMPTGSLWILLAPLVMTYLLIKFSGVGNMEQGITQRRPDYQAYIESTNTLIPGKPLRKVVDI